MFPYLIFLTASVFVSSYEIYDPGNYIDGTHGIHTGLDRAKEFFNEWTVEIDGGEEVAQLVALELGYLYGGPVTGFPAMYRFLKYEHEKQRRASQHTTTLIHDRRVRWAEQLFSKSRQKRVPMPDEKPHRAKRNPDQELERVMRVLKSEQKLERDKRESKLKEDHTKTEGELDRVKRESKPESDLERVGRETKSEEELDRVKRESKPESDLERVRREPKSEEVLERVKRDPLRRPELQRVKRLQDSFIQSMLFGDRKPMFNDELWGKEWYLQDTRSARSLPRLDLNVLPVYRMGYNGKGVRVSVLDDGIEHNHTDLRDNYDPDISWDCNDGDSDPTPRYQDIMTNSHGTRCAGEIAMTANNLKCGVGVAWGARIGGVRMLDGRITDRLEAEAIAYAADKVDVYSASWGPNDDGRTVEGPGRLAADAFKKGITVGRGGKGSIYVWANGNGGAHEDNCNCDGYSSSIYTVSIGSASQSGKFPWYGETCSSTLAAAYSSGAYSDQKIATTDTGDSCTLKHTGTSAAAPLAAGIVALALQANPSLTWRDVQHLIVWTSDYEPLSHNPGWQTNGVGLHFDVRFGFGLLNAAKLVKAALKWRTVPSKHTCRIEAAPMAKAETLLFSGESVEVEIEVDGCAVKYLEHVEVIVNVKYSYRGALEIYLTSPQGTKVQLLSARPKDNSTSGFVNWPMSSVATWGERPSGAWTVTFVDKSGRSHSGEVGTISLILHGTRDKPAHMSTGPTFSFEDIHQENIPELKFEEMEDPTGLFEQFEKQLLRMHHRKDDLSGFGF